MSENKFTVKFHGVRGSIPSPLVYEEVEEKVVKALQNAKAEHLAAILPVYLCRWVTNY
jgi:hypothetical protein